MDNKSLEMIEFPKVLEILAEFASFSTSRELVMQQEPSPDVERCICLLQQSAEARRFLSLNPTFAVGEVGDVREVVNLASVGKVLSTQDLLDIQASLAAAREMRNRFQRTLTQTPLLGKIAEQIVPFLELEQEISRCIDSSGDILGNASVRLAELRHEIRVTRNRLLDRLEDIIKSLSLQNVLQEAIITERANRYVIPVKAGFQNEVKGIIHDVSNTGATVFIEPLAIVDMGNELRQLALEEEREIHRILSSLSAWVGENSIAICRNLELMAELDLALTKARYAASAKATEARIITGKANSILKLKDARHPLLGDNAVPLTLEIGNDCSGLLITGPNTGGKTVALKTIGLLTAMTLSGIPIPASEESTIPVFDNIFADIGDEQSIEQTLSTFSWHMSNIVRILDSSTGNSLVLLDELGGSTDPIEGSALAQAIMLHFLAKGTLFVATTHYSELKAFAHSTQGLQNASLEFDPATLAPTYHLAMGTPGKSNALAIASRLGIPSEIIDSAMELLPKGSKEIEHLLTDLTLEKQTARMLRQGLEREKAVLAEERSRLNAERRDLEEQKVRIVRETRESLSREAAALHKEIHRASAEIRKASSRERVEQAQAVLNLVRGRLEKEPWQTKDSHPEGSVVTADISIGDAVKLIDTNIRGTVISLSEKTGQAEVHTGQMKIKVGIEELQKIELSGEEDIRPSFEFRSAPRQARRSIELDLRGKRAEEVEPELDAYLNDVSIAGYDRVRIIHGYGTGTIRRIVRDLLASYPLVKSFRSGNMEEGGDGVTIVEL